MKKTFAIALTILCSAAANALPLVWKADWPATKPCETLVHRGTDIELQPQWYINGELAASSNWTFQTFVQTNNQATGEWFGPLPGAAFSHTNDIGAAFYNVMVRAQMPGGGVNYTAFARLRMLDSPGYTPGELPLPVSTIDFSKVVALNAPWLLPDATNATLQASRSYTDGATNDLLSSACAYADTVSTLNGRGPNHDGFSAWTVKREGVDVTGQVLQPQYNEEIPDDWIIFYSLVDGDYGPPDAQGSEDATSLNWTAFDTTASVDVQYTATRTALPGYILGTQSNKVVASQTSLTALGNTLATNYYTISETDDAIDALAAYYITANAQGSAFATYAALTNATVYYSGGVARTPTRNDYCVVLADESHGGAEWRYIYTVAAGSTTGQWEAQYPIETNDYEALSNKPQINGHVLTNNQTGAALGLLDLTGGTINGNLALGGGRTLTLNGIDGETDPALIFANGSETGGPVVLYYTGGAQPSGVYVRLPTRTGTLALKGDVSLAALAATNYTNAAVLPKANISDLRYSFNAATVPAGATPTVTGLVDRAINAVTLGASVTVATNVLPAATANRARDFFIDLTIQSSDAPTIVFVDPARGTSAAVKYGADSLADIAPGNNLVLFTEIAPTNFLVSVKHEDAQ